MLIASVVFFVATRRPVLAVDEPRDRPVRLLVPEGGHAGEPVHAAPDVRAVPEVELADEVGRPEPASG